MAQNYTIIDVPGPAGMKIATTDTTVPGDKSVHTPEWMVSIVVSGSSIVNSNVSQACADIEGSLTQYCELFGWYGESSRFTSGDLGNDLTTSSSLKHSDVTLLMPNKAYSATIETKMNSGQFLEKIIILRLSWIEAAVQWIQKIEFGRCRIQAFQQQLDRLFVAFSPTTKTNTIQVYGIDGSPAGKFASTVDYAQNTAGGQ